MNRPNQYGEWLQRRKQVVVPTYFVSSVMQSILLETTPPTALRSRATARWSALMLAAGAFFVILCHAGAISLCLFAMTGVAQ